MYILTNVFSEIMHILYTIIYVFKIFTSYIYIYIYMCVCVVKIYTASLMYFLKLGIYYIYVVKIFILTIYIYI